MTKQKLFAVHFCLLRGLGGPKAKGRFRTSTGSSVSASALGGMHSITCVNSVWLFPSLRPRLHLCKHGFEFSWLRAVRSAWAFTSSSSGKGGAHPPAPCKGDKRVHSFGTVHLFSRYT